MKIIEFIQAKGKINSGDVANMFNISRQAALKELMKLVNIKILKPVRKGRGAYYILT